MAQPDREKHLERNFFIFFGIFFAVALLPILNDKTKLYLEFFIFGLWMGGVFSAIYQTIGDVIKEIKNLFKTPYKINFVVKIFFLVFFLIIASFLVYLIYFLNKYLDFLMRPVAPPWWFILVGIIFNFIWSVIYKRWLSKK
jgi:hypothetical protein